MSAAYCGGSASHRALTRATVCQLWALSSELTIVSSSRFAQSLLSAVVLAAELCDTLCERKDEGSEEGKGEDSLDNDSSLLRPALSIQRANVLSVDDLVQAVLRPALEGDVVVVVLVAFVVARHDSGISSTIRHRQLTKDFSSIVVVAVRSVIPPPVPEDGRPPPEPELGGGTCSIVWAGLPQKLPPNPVLPSLPLLFLPSHGRQSSDFHSLAARRAFNDDLEEQQH